jgi:hypothetical protein
MVRNEAIPASRPLHPEVLASLIDEGSATANITQVRKTLRPLLMPRKEMHSLRR